MYDTWYDPEAVIQEADLLMAEYAAEARHLARLEAKGICVHDALTWNTCDGCGVEFADDEDWFRARQDLMGY